MVPWVKEKENASKHRQRKREVEEADKVEVAQGVTVASLRRFRAALIGQTQGLALLSPSRFPNTIRFGSHPPLIRMSVPAHKSLLVRNIVSKLSHRVISRVRLYEVNRWSDLLRCTPMVRSKTRWCTMRTLA